MIAIRKAQPSDMQALCRMARAMHAVSPNRAYADMDIRSFAETVTDLTTNGTGAVFVAEIDGKVCGMSAIMVLELWFNQAYKTGQKLFLWIDKEYRIGHHAWKALLKAMEVFAKESGCKTCSICSSSDLPQDRLKKVYALWGYSLKDVFYIKEL